MDHRNSPEHGAPKNAIPSTKVSSTWVALAGGMILLAAVLTFILQNLRSVTVHFVTLDWRIPLGIDLLFAVIGGGLIIACAGSLRILQLRRLARRRARQQVLVVPDGATTSDDVPPAVGNPAGTAEFHAEP